MGKKGKGRQSGGFTHKSLRAQQQYELQQSISSFTNPGSRKPTKTNSSSSSSLVRPRLATGLSQLRGLLRERQFQEDVQLMERRRRNGFLPQPQDQQQNHHQQRQQNHRVCLVVGSSTNTNDFSNDPSSMLVHPAGWILKHSSPIFDSIVRDDRPHNYDNNENGDDDDDKEEDSTVPTLQVLCMNVFSLYLQDYIQALGRDEVRNAISMFPPSMITELSIMISSLSTSTTSFPVNKTISKNVKTPKKQNHDSSIIGPTGINDDIAYVLGNHQHVQQLCFRCGSSSGSEFLSTSTSTSSSTHSVLTDEGLLGLLPRMSQPVPLQNTKDDDDTINHDDDKHDDSDGDTKSREDGNKNDNNDNDGTWDNDNVVDDWEDANSDSDEDDFIDDHRYVRQSSNYNYLPPDRLLSTMALDGCNLKLRRLELLDCHYISSDVVLKLLDRCCGITHLSLAGSFVHKPMHGIRILKSLPQTLPSLLVLDVSRCTTWATPSLLADVIRQYCLVPGRDNNGSSSSNNANRIPLPVAYITDPQKTIINPPHQQHRPSSVQPGETIKDVW